MMNNNTYEIEKIVVGTLISEPKLMIQYSSKLSSDLFSNKNYQIIYEALEYLSNTSSIDMTLLIRYLNQKGYAFDNLVVDCLTSCSSSANIEQYIMILVEELIKKDYIIKFTKLVNLIKNENEDIFEIRNKTFEYLDNLFIDKFIDSNKQNVSFKTLISQVQHKFENITSDAITGIPSSLSIFNKAIGGWQDSDLTILAGRPGMGKTAIMIQQIIDSVIQGYRVGVFSLEMSAEQITSRLISNYTDIPNSSLLRKGLSNDEMDRYLSYKNSLENLPIHIDDTAGISIQNLRIKAKMMKMKYNIDILLVDYLQLISFEKANNREQEVGNISRKLKTIAKELNIPVIALSQLSRAVEQRPNKRPQLSDLRDSGSIEQDADQVIFLYRPEYYQIEEWDYYENAETKNECEIIIAKNRNGGLLAERVRVNLPKSQFFNLQ